MESELDKLATKLVGDGLSPNLYFVSDGSAVKLVTTDKFAAASAWRKLARRRPLRESALEDRHNGVLADVSPEDDEPGAKLRIYELR